MGVDLLSCHRVLWGLSLRDLHLIQGLVKFLCFCFLFCFSDILLKKKNREATEITDSLHAAKYLLSQMPEEAAPSIWIMTDGVIRVPTGETFDSLPMELSRSIPPPQIVWPIFLFGLPLLIFFFREGIICDIILVGSGYSPFDTFGFIPEIDDLEIFCRLVSGELFFSEDIFEIAEDTQLEVERRDSSFQGGSSFCLFVCLFFLITIISFPGCESSPALSFCSRICVQSLPPNSQ